MTYQVQHSSSADWNEKKWDAFVQGHPFSHPLQLSAWGKFKRAYGWDAQQVALDVGGSIVAGAQILFRRLPGPLPFKFAYIPKGPLLDWADTNQIRTLFAAIHRQTRARGALMLRIEPELPDTPEQRQRLQRWGFVPAPHSIQPQSTVWIDLTADEATILARMKQKWRYNIRLAGRKGVQVRQGNAADMAKFTELMQTTGQRKDFGVHEPHYYRAFWQQFAPAGHAALFLAEFQEQVLAGIVVAQLGDKAYYFYGASGNKHRNLMPSHLLQWEAMRWAKNRGCTAYDLWGIPDEVGQNPDAEIPNPPVGMWGVWRFKRGFGGQIVRYAGAWDKAYYPLVLPLARKFGL